MRAFLLKLIGWMPVKALCLLTQWNDDLYDILEEDSINRHCKRTDIPRGPINDIANRDSDRIAQQMVTGGDYDRSPFLDIINQGPMMPEGMGETVKSEVSEVDFMSGTGSYRGEGPKIDVRKK